MVFATTQKATYFYLSVLFINFLQSLKCKVYGIREFICLPSCWNCVNCIVMFIKCLLMGRQKGEEQERRCLVG